MAYAAANALAAVTNAAAALRTERDAATAGGAEAIAAMLEQAARRIETAGDRIRGVAAMTNWTPERAVDTLAAATPPIPARVENDRAIVDLASGGRLAIVSWAQAMPNDPRVGYAVAIYGPSGELATRLRAPDNPTLASIVARLSADAA